MILRAIEIAPARRYPDMAAFADDLERVARGEAPDPVTLRGAHPALRFIRRHRARLIAAAVLAAVLIPAGWLLTKRALDQAAARNDASVLRPVAWFAPEAFADGVGASERAAAQALGGNPAASGEERLMAAWVAYLAGDAKEAFGCIAADDRAFASRLLRAHMGALKDGAETSVHQTVRFGDSEALVPVDVSAGAVPLDSDLVREAGRERGSRRPARHSGRSPRARGPQVVGRPELARVRRVGRSRGDPGVARGGRGGSGHARFRPRTFAA